ncbi:MAG: hypothetical protein LAT55_04170 [Opitutales bacterium]|nr:hypothetical protein [Opitutales bacterium]
MSKSLLILSTDSDLVNSFTEQLSSLNTPVKNVSSPEEAISMAASGDFGLLIVSRGENFEQEREFLEALRKEAPSLPVYFVGERFKMAENIRAVRLGVRGVWSEPVDFEAAIPKISSLLGINTSSEEAAPAEEAAPTEKTSPSAKTSKGFRLGGSKKTGGAKTFTLPKRNPHSPTEEEEGSSEASTEEPVEELTQDGSEEAVETEAPVEDTNEEPPEDEPEEATGTEAPQGKKAGLRIGGSGSGMSIRPAAFGEMSDKLHRAEQEKETLREALEAEKQKTEEALAENPALKEEIERQKKEISALKDTLRGNETKLKAATENQESGGNVKEAKKELEALQKDLQKREASLDEEKKFLRQREAYLEECEEKLSEKTSTLDRREAEVQQQLEDLKNERKSLAESADGDNAKAINQKWLQEKIELQSRIADLEEQLENNKSSGSVNSGEMDELRRIEEATRHELEELESSLSAEKSARERAEEELAKVQDLLNQTRRKVSQNESQKDQIRERLDRMRNLLDEDANSE